MVNGIYINVINAPGRSRLHEQRFSLVRMNRRKSFGTNRLARLILIFWSVLVLVNK